MKNYTSHLSRDDSSYFLFHVLYETRYKQLICYVAITASVKLVGILNIQKIFDTIHLKQIRLKVGEQN